MIYCHFKGLVANIRDRNFSMTPPPPQAAHAEPYGATFDLMRTGVTVRDGNLPRLFLTKMNLVAEKVCNVL